MRPDPYKRARSRAYKAKHGMLPKKEAEKLPDINPQTGYLIEKDNYVSSLNESDDEDHFDLSSSELIQTFFTETGIDYLADSGKENIYSAMQSLVHGTQSELFFETFGLTIANCKDTSASSADTVLSGATLAKLSTSLLEKETIFIELRGSTEKSTSKSSSEESRQIVLTKNFAKSRSAEGSKEPLELEDWLDDVLK